ncbi:MAG: hypothetical protein AAF862_06700 [Pseudomonadota bacterium]
MSIDPATIPFRNPVALNSGNTRFSIEIELSEDNWLRFTLDADDEAARFDVAVLVARVAASSELSPYVPADPSPTNQDVNRERDRRLALGQALSISGYPQTIHVNWADQPNLTSVAVAAQAQISQGNGAQTITWRDNENVEHVLTYAQVLELHLVATAATSAIYQFSWILKQGTIPANYADDSYWQT